jgi:hypothetical protein
MRKNNTVRRLIILGHLKTFSFKALLNVPLVFIILLLSGRLGWGAALTIAVLLAAVSYAGDVYILPRTGNALAAAADGVIAEVLLWAVRSVGIFIEFRTIIYVAVAVVIVEGMVYHPYLKRLVSADSMGPGIGDRD